jgi:hypothetical protein
MHSYPRHQMEVSGRIHALGALPPGKQPSYHFDKRVNRASLEAVKIKFSCSCQGSR